MSDTGHHEYYVGNIHKKATLDQLRILLSDYGEITSFEFRLEKCTYCPTKIAFVTFSKALCERTIGELNRKIFQEKRLFFASTATEKYFTPLLTIVVRYLNENVSEEDIYKYFKQFGPLECVQKPANSYAYVSFENNEALKHAFKAKYRPQKGVEAYVVGVKRNISMFLENRKPMPYASIVEKCDSIHLIYDAGSENETTLLITNIPRDTEEDDLLDFLGKFGKIIDWEMQKCATCVLTNIGYVTYEHPKMARIVFLSGPLCFQGVGLEVYNHKLRYTTNDSRRALILKRTSVYLTVDEIFQKFSEYGRVEYIQRLDTVNYNIIVRLDSATAIKQAQAITNIAGEDVHIRSYTAKQYNSAMIAAPETALRKLPKRLRKEALLQQIIDTEDRRNLFHLQTKFNEHYFNPNSYYYRNEVQVWNYPSTFGLVEFRDFFKKYGTVINLRELKPHRSAPIGVAYLSFETKLEAKRVAKMNQTFIGSKRLLMLMADEMIVHDPALCLKVGNLTEEIMDEDIYDRFNMIAKVKYVFRPQMNEAIVCMVEELSLKKAVRVVCVGRFPVSITPFMKANNKYDSQTGVAHAGPTMMQNSAPPAYGMASMEMIPGSAAPSNQWNPAVDNLAVGSMLLEPHGPMAFGIGMEPRILPVPAPVPHPVLSHMVMSGAPTGMNDPISMQSGIPYISPRMRGLMQAVEVKMIKSKNFTTLPMVDQFNVVHEIVNHCLNFAQFLTLSSDEKIRYVISGQNGFRYMNIFTLFTYPEQVEMLSVIESYYRATFNQGSMEPTYNTEPIESNFIQSNILVVLTQDTQNSSETTSHVNYSNVTAAKTSVDQHTQDGDDDGNQEQEDIPPAPSPPPIFSRSRSASPLSDDAKVQSRSMVLNGAAQRLRESAMRKRNSDGSNLNDEITGNSRHSQVGGSKRKRSKTKDGYLITARTIFVSNVPNEMTEKNVREIFQRCGRITSMLEQKAHILNPNSNPNSKGFVIQYETINQAFRAMDMHLTMLLGQLIRVDQYKNQYKERPGHAISVTCSENYSEVEIYETFKSCGEIRFIWTRVINKKETCIIDYTDPRTVNAALKITYLHSGGRCKVSVI